MKNVIAFFDFDGTVTHKDSLLEFIKYVKGAPAFYFGFLINAPVLIAYKLKIISNQRAKEIMLWHFFGNVTMASFREHCEAFTRDRLPGLLRPKALREIEKLRAQGAEIVIVSASPEYWLRYWCDEMNFKCIATRLITRNDRITGKIDGLNCYGEEKVRRITESFNLDSFSSVYCYGDTPGDRYMLALADYRFYKPFR